MRYIFHFALRFLGNDNVNNFGPAAGLPRVVARIAQAAALLFAFGAPSSPLQAQQVEPTLPLSQRMQIDLAAGVPQYIANAASGSNAPQSQWLFENASNSTTYSSPSFVESTDPNATWKTVGLPYDANIPRTFINQTSGGGQGSLTGNENWYRLHFKVDPKYAGRKFMLNLEGTHTGVQVFINGTLLPGISAVAADSKATHVVGFVPVVVDLTPYLHTDGVTDNVIAVDVSRGNTWFEQPGFSGAFRFGQAMAGLFRKVYLYVANPVHIPLNVYSNQKTWGTYVGTVSEVPAAEGTATAASAVVEVQTNVVNETSTTQQVTLTTQIVDASGNVVVTAPPITQAVPPMTAGTFPSTPAPMFRQQITLQNPTLWYPNNSIYGSPYLYKVYHIVSVNGAVVDSAQSPLGVRTITWDGNFPYFNGHAMYLWGGSGRYDYPALGSSVPDEQQWRDLAQIAAQGGNIWRPGHSTSSEELVEAADAYGIMIIQPSGDGEGAFTNPSADDAQLKRELHRDMIIRDRSHPSIVYWEEDNGGNNPTLADALATIETSWDSINPRAQASRAYLPSYAYIDECDGAGCEIGNKSQYPNNPAFGAEYWDNMGTGRGLAWDYELAFAAPYLDDWRRGREANAFGMAQWYFADSPGEVSLYAEFQNQPTMSNFVRSLGYSSVDMNRFPRLLYYIYQANWVPYSVKPMVHLAHHWNRAYEYTAGTPIQENAFSNCPSVRLLVNGVAKDPVTGATLADQTPNAWNVVSNSNLTQATTVMPGQAHWMVNWAAGTVTAECLDVNGNVVPGVSDSVTTAGAEYKIVLSAVPELTKPDGSSFQWSANGSDAAFVVAQVQDANGNIVHTAADNVTFSVSGPASYMGGSQQYVADPSWTNYYQDAFSRANSNVINGMPYAFFHAPGDPELNFEGGLTKIALRSTFTPGTVTVTATAPGLVSGSVQLTSVTPPAPALTQAPVIIVPPANASVSAGYAATFSVAASGSGVLTYQWYANGSAIAGATGTSYTTPAATLAQNGETFSVTVTSSSGLGSVTSNPATLTVDADAGVSIATQPASQTAVVGQTATLSVAANGSPTLNYAWYENGSQVASGPQASYTTPLLTATGTQNFYVIVSNPLGQVQSSTAVLTVNAPTPVSITSQPASQIVAVSQPVQFSAVVAGSPPYTYQWQFTPAGGSATVLLSNTQSSNTITYTIPAMSAANVGAYTLTVNNAANAAATSAAAQLTLAPPGVNLALGKTATASSSQNACTDATTTPPYSGTGCLGAENAVDGSLTTRWGSATAGAPPTPPVAGVDPSWLQVDLGSVQPFNTVIINWENAYAAQYQIQYTSANPSTNPTWNVAYANNAGAGGTETLNFPTVQGRYIRMYGTQRATQYGYSMYEFQVYNVPQCGGANERYTVNASNQSLVTDNLTGLSWTRTIETDTTPGSQFTGINAASYCAGINMRLPTETEALGISGNNNASCAFPGAWSTWTSTVDPNDASETAIVNFTGSTSWNVTNNYPGQTLCAAGTATGTAPAIPVIQTQPQAATVTAGQTATFSVVATGTPAPSFQWYKNGAAISGATSASYSTPAEVVTDGGAVFTVVVSNAAGSVTSSGATLTVNAASGTGCSTVPSVPGAVTAAATSSSQISLSWNAGTSACAVTYTVYRGTVSGFLPASGTQVSGISGTTFVDTGLSASTTYYYLVEAVDSAGASAASTQASATTLQASGSTGSSSDIVAIGAGGKGAGNFAADEDFTGGGTTTTGSNISTAGVANAAPEAVYQSERAGVFTYTIPGLTAGMSYGVRLHFAEFYWTKAGQRVFNVSINGTPVLSNFDIIAAAGGPDIALVESFSATANLNGQIVISFAAGSADQPKISGIEILPAPATRDIVAISAGGKGAGSFAADEDFIGGGTTTTGNVISAAGVVNAAPEAVYQSERAGTFTYTIPNLTAGTSYGVRLHFAEFYWTKAGQRVFNVSINGTTVLSNFDIIATAGSANLALVESFTATANLNGQIVISFTPGSADHPKVSGVEILPAPAVQDIVAIGAGASAVVGNFAADKDFIGGGATTTTNAITTVGVANAAPQAVYRSERHGTFTYTIAGLTAGTSYSLRLHFAEFYWTKAGQRVFNVSINGTPVLSNFDIVAAAGGPNVALVEPFTVAANANGQIVIAFTNGTADQPKISGIEVLPVLSTVDVAAIGAGESGVVGIFAADRDFVGGGTTTNGNPVSMVGLVNAAPEAIYQSERHGDFTYTISSLKVGATYGVRLHFAEFYWTKAGQRVFNVSINGNPVLKNFDIIATAGGPEIALVEPFTATADSQGQIVFDFTSGAADQPKISGIEVFVPGATAVGGTGSTGTGTGTGCSAVPSVPATLIATAASDSQIGLTWGASTSNCAVTYDVYRSTTAGFTPAAGNQVGTATGTSYSDTGLAASTTYYYAVAAVNSVGASAATAQAHATTAAAVVTPPTGAPTIATQPANQTSTVGATATFSVVASGTGSFTYQWQLNGQAIAGATSARYTTPALTAAANGSVYAVVVGNGGTSTVTSSNATLSVGPYTVYADAIGVNLVNNTHGAWADNQVYVTIVGMDPKNNNAFAYVNASGQIVDFTLADSSAANHLTGPDGNAYGNYSFTIDQAPLLKLPPITSARAYISLGAPLYMAVHGTNGQVTGYAGPAPWNSADPNAKTHFDWYEFNYALNADGSTGVYINTTQVDMFGLPLVLDVWASGGSFHQEVGIAETIAQLDSEYAAQVPAAFQPSSITSLNIFSPDKIASMEAGGPNANYFANVIQTAWTSYAKTPITIPLAGRQFTGTASGTTLTFTEVNPARQNAGETFVVQQPPTQDILACSGTMANGVTVTAAAGTALAAQQTDENNVQQQLENQICSATNRGILLAPTSTWATASTYYGSAPANFYSWFWHRHSIGGLAYGFSFDDNNNQSTTIQTPGPEHMTWTVGY